MKNISIIGSTGSIGTQALKVIAERGYSVCALAAAGRNIDLFESQIRQFKPAVAAVYDEEAGKELKRRISDCKTRVCCGSDGVCLAASEGNADITLNAVVGIAGLLPTIAAIEAGNTLALANKESLVCAGELVCRLAKEKKVDILPVDSEHSAVFQCLRCGNKGEVEKVILTASGGPFFGRSPHQLKGVTASQALMHPNWDMGAKITIDSATMMNKAFEVVEAKYLFDLAPEQIDVLVHRESIIHSMVEYKDGSVVAQMAMPDMCLPIQYALDYPDRQGRIVGKLDLVKLGSLTFAKPDTEAFPALLFGEKIIKTGGNMGAAVNGANEAAVASFLRGEIGFWDIYELVSQAAQYIKHIEKPGLNEIFSTDAEARTYVLERIKAVI